MLIALGPNAVKSKTSHLSIGSIADLWTLTRLRDAQKFSPATVSRAINRVPTVDPQLVRRVYKLIEQLGYYPNTQACLWYSGNSIYIC